MRNRAWCAADEVVTDSSGRGSRTHWCEDDVRGWYEKTDRSGRAKISGGKIIVGNSRNNLEAHNLRKMNMYVKKNVLLFL